MATLISGFNFTSMYEKLLIIDCRFAYEFDGGHIRGAINVNATDDLAELLFCPEMLAYGNKLCVILHCEFSSQRGPKMCVLLHFLFPACALALNFFAHFSFFTQVSPPEKA